MMNIFKDIKAGFRHLKTKPQLWWTAILGILIITGFALTASMFVSVAQNAQERLINVRIGSIQDVLSEFAPLHIHEPQVLQEKIQDISSINETIKSFKILKIEGNDAVVIASLDPDDIGTLENDFNDVLLMSFLRDHKNSYTFKRFNEERLYDTVRSIVDDRGNVIGAIVTTQTLSEADKLIDLSIKRSIIILVAIVILIMVLFLRHSKTIDYIALYRQLKEIDQLKDDFIGMASHELRTPLSIISGYASLIAESEDLSEDDRDNINKINISIKNLNELVTDMLDVSRIEQGRIELELEKSNPDEIINSQLEGFEIQAKGKGLIFTSNLNGHELINIDPVRFKQVINNLLSNAIKYTPKGKVTVESKVQNKNYVLKIVDTGVGMSSQEQERLFAKFYRIKTSDTRGISGTGLGLWITKELVTKMNGTIEVQSIKGIGTHFIVKFPVA